MGDGAAPARRRGRPRGAKTRLLREGSGELGRHHFAFLRALLDGVDLERAWKLYLSFSGGPSDRRHFASRLRQVVQAIDRAGATRGCGSELAVALPALRALPDFAAARSARGAGRAGHIEAPEAEPRAASAKPPSPTLDDWRSQYCGATGIDEDFYTEAEWLELYCEEFGTEAAARQTEAGKAGHVAAPPSPALPATTHVRIIEESPPAAAPRLSESQRKAVVEALVTLEHVLSREPSLDDDAGFWLGSGIPRDLPKVGLKSIGDLINYINIYGFRWHRRVPRMGVVRARRLLDWLTPIAEAGGRPSKSPPGARRPTSPCCVDGNWQVGGWPAQCPLPWCPSSTARCPMPCQADRGPSDPWRPTPGARILAAPPADLAQERKEQREDAAWRPLRGPLGRNSQRHEFTVLGSMFSAMHDKGYLRANAMATLGRTLGLLKPSIDVRRSLSGRQWSFAMDVLHE
jgi:hypothetical protein